MTSLSHVLWEKTKEVHVLLEAITLRSGVMTIKVVVFVFGSMLVFDWYLEWALFGPLGCEYGSTVCDLRESTFSITSDPWLVP